MKAEPVTEPDVFGEFDSIAAIMGFIHHTSGDNGLLELLATTKAISTNSPFAYIVLAS